MMSAQQEEEDRLAEILRAILDLSGTKRANQSKWCLLIDTRLYVEPGDEFSHQQRQGKPEESYCSYFKPDWIQSLFPDGKVHAPVRPEWQHCCVLTRSSRANRT